MLAKGLKSNGALKEIQPLPPPPTAGELVI